MKQAMAEMDCTTAYLVYDFKQKFLAKAFTKVVILIMAKRACYGGEQEHM